MTVVAGIDEAGYGPVLGPLVVAASAYRLEDGAKERDLDRLVKLRRDDGGLAVRDSKQLYPGGGDVTAIETTTLGHAALGRGVLPLRVDALLAGGVDFDPAEVRRLPWYADRLLAMRLPRRAAVDDVLRRAERTGEILAERGIRFLDTCVAVVPEPRFNRLTAAADSKAWTLFYAAGRLIESLVRAYPHEPLVIHVDRHGGRLHYAELLQTFFPLAPLTTLRERRNESAYGLDWPGRAPVRIDFRIKADDTRTPVALASVVAKTVRELFMESLNAWFAERAPEVRGTAGYYGDAHRFLDEVAGKMPLDEHRELLVRCR